MAEAGKIGRIWIDAQEWALDRLAARAGRNQTIAPHLVTGLLGERATLFELRRHGLTVVARRWTNAKMRGDVDLIGWDGGQLCFVEVKTRTARDMKPAESAVDEDKRNMIRGLAKAYLQTFPERERKTISVRFDVVSVYAINGAREFEFFEGAFGWR